MSGEVQVLVEEEKTHETSIELTYNMPKEKWKTAHVKFVSGRAKYLSSRRGGGER